MRRAWDGSEEERRGDGTGPPPPPRVRQCCAGSPTREGGAQQPAVGPGRLAGALAEAKSLVTAAGHRQVADKMRQRVDAAKPQTRELPERRRPERKNYDRPASAASGGADPLAGPHRPGEVVADGAGGSPIFLRMLSREKLWVGKERWCIAMRNGELPVNFSESR